MFEFDRNGIYSGGATRLLGILSHTLATLTTLLVTSTLLESGLIWWAFLVTLGIGIGVGVIFTHPLHRGLDLIETALQRLADGEPIAVLNEYGREPLQTLIHKVNRLIEQHQKTGNMRDQLVSQISEAAAQEERNRLARDLHDSIKQQIFSISVSAAAANARLETDLPGARAALADARQSAQEALVEMRAMLQQLSPSPLEKSGLIQALRDQCEALAYRTGAHVKVDLGSLPGDEKLPIGSQEALFRIAQEGLSNVARHARAKNVALSLHEVDDSIRLTIEDDGKGFDMQALGHGMGLHNMQERAQRCEGVMHVESEPGQGTTLHITIPLVASQPETTAPDCKHPQLQRAIHSHYTVTGALSIIIVAVSLLLTGWLRNGPAMFQDLIDTVIFGGFSIAAIIAVPVMFWAYFRAQPAIQAVEIDHDGASLYELKRNQALGRALVLASSMWLVPLVLFQLSLPSATIVVAIMPLALMLGYAVFESQRMRTRHYDALSSGSQRAMLGQVRSARNHGRISLGLLAIAMLATGFLQDLTEIAWPLDSESWTTIVFLIAIVVGGGVHLADERWYQQRQKSETTGETNQ